MQCSLDLLTRFAVATDTEYVSGYLSLFITCMHGLHVVFTLSLGGIMVSLVWKANGPIYTRNA